MIDIKLLREHPDIVKKAAETKNADISDKDIDHILELDEKRRQLLAKAEATRRERNELASKTKGGKPSEEHLAKGKELKEQLAKQEAEHGKVEAEYLRLMELVPNIPTNDVPVGKSEDENVVSKTVGEKTKFDFEPLNHWQIAEKHGWIDKERAAKVAGARFAYLKGGIVRLQWALMMYGLDVLMNEAILKQIADEAGLDVSTRPFVPVLPPAVARTEVYQATGRLKKGEETYKIEDEDLWLNASAEHTLAPKKTTKS